MFVNKYYYLLLFLILFFINACASQPTTSYNVSNNGNFEELKNDLTSLRNEIQSLNSNINKLQLDLQNAQRQIQQLESELENSKSDITKLKSQLQTLQLQADSSTAYELMRKELTNPTDIISKSIVSQLKLQNSQLSEVAENVVSVALKNKLPTVNWVKDSIVPISGRNYKTIMKTEFPIEIDTGIPIIGTITLAKIVVKVSGNVGIENEVVTNLQVESVAS